MAFYRNSRSLKHDASWRGFIRGGLRKSSSWRCGRTCHALCHSATSAANHLHAHRLTAQRTGRNVGKSGVDFGMAIDFSTDRIAGSFGQHIVVANVQRERKPSPLLFASRGHQEANLHPWSRTRVRSWSLILRGASFYTPSSSTDPRRSFSTPVTPTSANRKIIVTPSTSGGSTRHYYGRGGQSASSTAVVVNSNVKTEARRKLNMDNASSLVSGTVDREGFKTPIKSSTKRRADFSSPSPRKSKTPFEFLAVIYDSCLLGCLITGSLA